MTLPDWYGLLLIGLGVYRICRLVGWDDITAPIRTRLVLDDAAHSQWTWALNGIQAIGSDPWDYTHTDVFLDDAFAGNGQTTGTMNIPPLVWKRIARNRDTVEPIIEPHIVPFSKSRWYVSKLIRCPWCLGWWVTLTVWLVYQAASHGTLIVMSLFAASAIPGLVTKNLDR